jgi:phosphate transport system permease protein
MLTITGICTVLLIIPLLLILGYLVVKGVSFINLDFFTQLPKPVGEPGGGMANALIGSLLLISLASAFGIVAGLGAGIYVSEYGHNWLGRTVRFLAETLNSTPSIVIGIFAYVLVVMPMKRFSLLSGSVALAIIMIPIVSRTSEEVLKLVPRSLREASLALGISEWRTTWSIVVRTALPGIVTGSMLALARIAGETAPLLFTSFNNRFWSVAIDQPISSLPVQIFNYAISPYETWRHQAWAAALVLVVLVLILSLLARLVVSSSTTRSRA